VALFYKRDETENEITICFKKRCLFYIALLMGLVLAFFFSQVGNIIWWALLILIVIYIIDMWKPGREISKAVEKGYINKISGSKYSFSKPLTIVINKQSDNSGREE